MSSIENGGSKVKRLAAGRILLIIGATLLLAVSATAFGIIIAANNSINKELASWFFIAVLTVAVLAVTYYMTIKTNNLRVYYALDYDGNLYCLDVSNINPQKGYAYTSVGWIAKDISDTAKGIKQVEEVLQSGSIASYAIRIRSVSKIRKTVGFWKITCRAVQSNGNETSRWLHIPLNAVDAELLIDEFMRIKRDSE